MFGVYFFRTSSDLSDIAHHFDLATPFSKQHTGVPNELSRISSLHPLLFTEQILPSSYQSHWISIIRSASGTQISPSLAWPICEDACEGEEVAGWSDEDK